MATYTTSSYSSSPFYYVLNNENGTSTYTIYDGTYSDFEHRYYSSTDAFEKWKRQLKDDKGAVNRHFIEIQTITHNDFINSLKEKISKYDNDEEKSLRSTSHTCKYCWYMKIRTTPDIDSVENSDCPICGKHIESSFYPNKIICCDDCAEKYHICKYCGAELD